MIRLAFDSVESWFSKQDRNLLSGDAQKGEQTTKNKDAMVKSESFLHIAVVFLWFDAFFFRFNLYKGSSNFDELK